MTVKGVIFDFGFTLFYFKEVSIEKYMNCYKKGLNDSIEHLKQSNIINTNEITREFKNIFVSSRKVFFERSRINNFEYTTAYIFQHVLERLINKGLIAEKSAQIPFLIEELADIYHSYEENEWIPFSYTRETLDNLSRKKKLKLAVLSNHPHHRMIQNLLKKYDFCHYFDTVITSAKYGRRKPDPSIFIHALEMMGLKGHAEECFMCGDEHADIVGGHEVGLKTILCERSYKFPFEKVIKFDDFFRVSDISEILNYLE
ncbi:MAG: HAD family hydrolase [Promethearchaeota archaeon]